MEPISKERTDNLDGSYVIKEVYDVNYLNDYLSQIKNYDKNGIWLGGISYKDKFFKEVLYNYKIESKENGTYIKKAIYLAPDEVGILSFIEEFDKNDKLLSGKYYKDKEFKELYCVVNHTYREDGSYTNTFVYSEPSENGNLSVIEEYDKNDKFLSGKYYKDKEFKELDYSVNRTYREDGSYTKTFVYSEPSENGNLSVIAEFDKNDKLLSAKYYKDKEFKELRLTTDCTYREDGSYTKTFVYSEPSENGNLSVITEYDKNDKLLSAKYYKDKEFKELSRSVNRTYREDGSYTNTFVYSEPSENGNLSVITEYDKNDKLLSAKYYKDKELKELNYSGNRTYREDGSYTETFVYSEPDKDGDLSSIEEYDKNDKLLSAKYYKDKEFKELDYSVNRTYREDESYTNTFVYSEPNKDGDLSSIEEYDKNDKLLSAKYYKDKEFKELRLTTDCTYREDGSYTKTFVYSEPNKDGDLSCIAEYDKNDKLLSVKYYKDKEFKELSRQKHNKHSLIQVLTIVLFLLLVVKIAVKVVKVLNF